MECKAGDWFSSTADILSRPTDRSSLCLIGIRTPPQSSSRNTGTVVLASGGCRAGSSHSFRARAKVL